MRVLADVRAPRVLTLARGGCAGGERALLIAAKAGREDLVELLADFKADLDQGYDQGMTALHSASQEGHLADGAVPLEGRRGCGGERQGESQT